MEPEVTEPLLTEEPGEEIIQKVIEVDPTTGEPLDHISQEEYDNLINLLTEIKNNTVPTVADPNSNPSGMGLTFEQGQVILDHLNTIEVVGLAVVGTVLVIFVAKQVYKFFGGLIFGGL